MHPLPLLPVASHGLRRSLAALAFAVVSAAPLTAPPAAAAAQHEHGILLRQTTAQADPAGPLEVFAALDEPPGYVAQTPDGRVFVAMHGFASAEFKIQEVTAGGRLTPYPTEQWSRVPTADEPRIGMDGYVSVRSDADGLLWILNGGTAREPRVVVWDTRSESLARIIPIPHNALAPNSFVQDFALGPRHGAIFFADNGRADLVGHSEPAIVVLDLATGTATRRLVGHPSVVHDGTPNTPGGRPQTINTPRGDLVAAFALNPITIDDAQDWVYYGAMHGGRVYRVRAADLLDRSISDLELGNLVQAYGAKPSSDGITIDAAGNVYISDLSNNSIGVTRPNGAYEVLYRDDALLLWVNGFSCGSDGYVYAATNQAFRRAVFNGGVDQARPPFHLVRFRPLAPCTLGR